MKKIIFLLLLAANTNIFAQVWPLQKLVLEAQQKGTVFADFSPFTFIADKQATGFGTYQKLLFNEAASSKLMAEKPAAIRMVIPLSNTKIMAFDLVRIQMGNIKFTENNSTIIPDVKIPLMYRGVVSGEQNKSLVVLTVTENQLSFLATLADKTIQLAKAPATNPGAYFLYNSKSINVPSTEMKCHTPAKNNPISDNGVLITGQQRPDSTQLKCINVFVDCFDSLYVQQGSNKQQTINYAMTLFNAVGTFYASEQMNIRITSINVWTTATPIRRDSSGTAQTDFAAIYKDNFWGNLSVGLDFAAAGLGGLAGDIGRVKATSPDNCKAYTSDKNEFCYADLNFIGTFTNFPVIPTLTAGVIEVVIHEIGHQLGSHHTHWCGWQLTSSPVTYGAIDNCVANTEGGCPVGPAPGPTGGTIMSYCHLNASGSFINYQNGFGPLPGNAIRNFVDQTSCIPTCLDCLYGSMLRTVGDELSYIKLPLRVANKSVSCTVVSK